MPQPTPVLGLTYPETHDPNALPFIVQRFLMQIEAYLVTLQEREAPYAVTMRTTPVTDVDSSPRTIMTASPSIPAGRRVKVSFQARTYSTAIGDVAIVRLREGSTTLGEWPLPANSSPTIAATTNSVSGSVVLSPPAGPHTYTLELVRALGSGLVTASASVTMPAHLTVDDAGAVA